MVAVRVDLAVGEKLVRQGLADRGTSAWRSRKWKESPLSLWKEPFLGKGRTRRRAW